MNEYRIRMPASLAPKYVCSLTCELERLPDADRYVLDFVDLKTTQPFGMLVLAAAVRRLQQRCQLMGRKVTAANYENAPYAAHMGLFTSFGLDFGNSPGQAAGSSTYIPITSLTLQELTRRSGGYQPVGDVIEEESRRIARLLLLGCSDFVQAQFSYCIREMVRNVVEHSEGEKVWYAGQFWPSKRTVEVSVLDEGIGIKRSLEKNAQYRPSKDIDALRLAVQRGTSSAADRDPWGANCGFGARSGEVYESGWVNAGMGLYFVSRLCAENGRFAIASGASFLAEERRGPWEKPASVAGTAVCLQLRTDQPDAIAGTLQQIGLSGSGEARRRSSYPSW